MGGGVGENSFTLLKLFQLKEENVMKNEKRGIIGYFPLNQMFITIL